MISDAECADREWDSKFYAKKSEGSEELTELDESEVQIQDMITWMERIK